MCSSSSSSPFASPDSAPTQHPRTPPEPPHVNCVSSHAHLTSQRRIHLPHPPPLSALQHRMRFAALIAPSHLARTESRTAWPQSSLSQIQEILMRFASATSPYRNSHSHLPAVTASVSTATTRQASEEPPFSISARETTTPRFALRADCLLFRRTTNMPQGSSVLRSVI